MTGQVVGDLYGLALPVDPIALRDGGTEFLTAAFTASGALSAGNRVVAITDFREVSGGSTGRKALLSVAYATPDRTLHTDLFAKFSRDFDDPVRDRGKTQMDSEVRFAALASTPDFPITVPVTQFGDYHRASGSGLLITERITFGHHGIERHYEKCLDYIMPDQVGHYRALVTALAQLVGAHRSGRLPADLVAHLPIDLQAATVGERPVITPAQLDRRLTRVVEFCRTHTGLLPANLRDEEFLARIADDGQRLLAHDSLIWGHLADPHHIALCHWNANVDNAWFWRDPEGALQCGLMDWGCVSQMNVAMAIWGAMAAAETDLWDCHFDELVQLFVVEVGRAGGPVLDPARLRDHVLLYAAIMGITWLLDVPSRVRARIGVSSPGLARTDPRISADESVRAPLQMLTNVLNLWQVHRFGDVLDSILT